MCKISITKRVISKVVLTFYSIIALLTAVPQAISAPPPVKTVAIVQIIEHPALDETRQGIIDTLAKTSPNTKIIWESAQGSPVLATQICQSYVGKNVDLIVAIATTPAQAAVSAVKGTNIPVVFSSVTDAESAKLVGVSTGVLNFVDVDRQLEVVWKTLPNIKALGMIYNPGEAFSDRILKLTQEACQKRGIKFVSAVATKTSEVGPAAQALVDQVDGIFINNDNVALAAFPTIVNVCNQKKIPVFASDTDVIEKGALAVLGPDQYRVGIQTANIIQKLLDNPANMKDIKIEGPDSVELRFNLAQTN